MTLLRAMASCLEMESVDGLRPIGHIPKDERDRLLVERENTCQILANRIKVLQERIARKEELLQGYERDLAKLRWKILDTFNNFYIYINFRKLEKKFSWTVFLIIYQSNQKSRCVSTLYMYLVVDG